MLLSLVPRSMSSLSHEATPTSPNDVQNAARYGKQGATGIVSTTMEVAATVIHLVVNYSQRCALIVARKLKYHSSPARVDQCIAVIAFVK